MNLTLAFILVAMTKKDILTNYQVLTEELTLPFHVALTKLPSQIKVMKWGDYLVCWLHLSLLLTGKLTVFYHGRK